MPYSCTFTYVSVNTIHRNHRVVNEANESLQKLNTPFWGLTIWRWLPSKLSQYQIHKMLISSLYAYVSRYMYITFA